MKKLPIILISVLILSNKSYANNYDKYLADNQFYLQKNYVFDWKILAKKNNILSNKKQFLDNSIAFGYSYNLQSYNRVRSELELQYAKIKLPSSNFNEDHKLNIVNKGRLLFNLYYDFNIDKIPGLKFYIGSGIGLIQDIKIMILNFIINTEKQQKQDNINFTFQGMAGLEYQISNKLEIYGGYRYISDFNKSLNNLSQNNHILNFIYTQFTNYNTQNNSSHVTSFGGLSIGIKYNF